MYRVAPDSEDEVDVRVACGSCWYDADEEKLPVVPVTMPLAAELGTTFGKLPGDRLGSDVVPETLPLPYGA